MIQQWLRMHASQQERRNNTRTFLAIIPGTEHVVGYFSTTAYRVELDEMSESLRGEIKASGRYPIPAILLARLAVDSNWMGSGIGKQLLVGALTEIAKANQSVGFEIVVVDAIDDEAVTFYTRYGFIQFENHSLKLFMPMKHLLKTLDAV